MDGGKMLAYLRGLRSDSGKSLPPRGSRFGGGKMLACLRGKPLRQGKQRVWVPTAKGDASPTPACRGQSPQAPTLYNAIIYEMR